MKIEITWDGRWWKAQSADLNLAGYGRTIEIALGGLDYRMKRGGGTGIVDPQLIFAAAGELGELVARRGDAMVELRKAQCACEVASGAAVAALSSAGMSLGAIAIVLDLSKTRVHQLLARQSEPAFSGVNERPTGDERSAD